MNKHFSNERGFALLLSFVILFISSSLLLHLLIIYESEKEFITMEKDGNTLEHLLLSSSEYVLQSLPLGGDSTTSEGTFHYTEGDVHYTVSENDETYLITIRALLKNGSRKGCQFSYIKDTGDIINWEERVNL